MNLTQHSSATPPYSVQESTRINALESTIQKMTSDLSSSKEQLREVKELLLRLMNPHVPATASTSEHAPTSNNAQVPRMTTPGPTQPTYRDNVSIDEFSQVRQNVETIAPEPMIARPALITTLAGTSSASPS
ncbi:hypothetical protein M758_UG067200 [Ceratodon purpureus]|nr:hypothetical protein M758_UG067200 [Ceratodon purpureus]